MEDKSTWTPERRAEEIAILAPGLYMKWRDELGVQHALGAFVSELKDLIERGIKDAIASDRAQREKDDADWHNGTGMWAAQDETE